MSCSLKSPLTVTGLSQKLSLFGYKKAQMDKSHTKVLILPPSALVFLT